MPESKITKEKCPVEEKITFLPRYLGTGRYLLHYQPLVYTLMRRHARNYAGGFWDFFSLSNGGVFISLADEDRRFLVNQPSNHYQGEMSAEAASIGMNLYVFCAFSEEDESFLTRFYALLDYAHQHEEAAEIAGFID